MARLNLIIVCDMHVHHGCVQVFEQSLCTGSLSSKENHSYSCFCSVGYNFIVADDIEQVSILEPFMLEMRQKLPVTCHLLFCPEFFFSAFSRKQA